MFWRGASHNALDVEDKQDIGKWRMRPSNWRINFDLSHMVAGAGSLQEFCTKPAMLQVSICAVTKQGRMMFGKEIRYLPRKMLFSMMVQTKSDEPCDRDREKRLIDTPIWEMGFAEVAVDSVLAGWWALWELITVVTSFLISSQTLIT